MKNHPIFANKFVKSLLKFLAFMVCWAVLATLFNALMPPKHHQPNTIFSVCIIENNQPTLIRLTDLNHHVLCTQETSQTKEDNPAFSFRLRQIKDDWEITEYADSPADPIVYHYQIKNNQVIPKWFSMGGMTNSMLNWFWAFWVALIAYEIRQSIHRRKQKSANS
ncbi:MULTISPECIES: hypothetical protein [unclassified Moraxella]|uniref:hypothetical protein n=1 Tax=unclassified Moraxella TaxID=2685852 RepID=UPI003AF7AEBB